MKITLRKRWWANRVKCEKEHVVSRIDYTDKYICQLPETYLDAMDIIRNHTHRRHDKKIKLNLDIGHSYMCVRMISARTLLQGDVY